MKSFLAEKSTFDEKRLHAIKALAAHIAISLENNNFHINRKKAEKKYQAIFKNAFEGIIQSTLEDCIMNSNSAMENLIGRAPYESLKDFFSDIPKEHFVHSEKGEEFIKLLIENPKSSDQVVEFYKKNNDIFWHWLHAKLLFGKNQKPALIELSSADSAERKNDIQSLLEKERSLCKESLRSRLIERNRYKFADIIGKSGKMQEVFDLITRAAATDANVIIYGESGTGKELVAKAVHKMSRRKNREMVPVNCGAITENLLESEFFGYKKGAFTGANADKQGFLDLADNGTIFLDELGELNLNIQAKLLRAIDGGGYTPVGSTIVKKADFRIIAATNRNLQDRVKKGMMRADFFYRIHVIPIYLPPLRERKEDIPLLIDHFLKAHAFKNDPPSITGNILEAMLNYNWPGNVRELENTLYRFVSIGRLDFLGGSIPSKINEKDVIMEAMKKETLSLQEATSYFEKIYISKILHQYKWHRKNVASILRISRRTLYDKMRKFQINKCNKKNHGT